MEFTQSTADYCLYYDSVAIYLLIYVDILLAGANPIELATINIQLASEFNMRGLGDVKHFVKLAILLCCKGYRKKAV